MNLLLLEAREIDAQRRAVLEGRRAEHLIKVLKVAPDDRVRAGIVGAGVGHARVLSVGRGRVDLEVDIDRAVAAEPGLDLVVGLPRPQVLNRVVQFSASMGVRRLHLVNAWRVEKSYFQSPAVSAEKLRNHALLGSEQGRTTCVPQVSLEPLFVPFVRGLGAGRVETSAPEPGEAPLTHMLVAHPTADDPIETVVTRILENHQVGAPRAGTASKHHRWIMAIGPEGGWIDREVETLREVGFEPFTLGPWILRVEAALVSALSQLHLARRMLDSSTS